jgi:hypothetical protein
VRRESGARAGVRAEAAWRAPGGDDRRLAAAAAAGRACEVERVVGAAVHLVVGLDAPAVGRAVGLAEEDGSGGLHTGDGRGVLVRHHADPFRHADRHLDPRGADVVLDRERDAVQHACGLTAREARIRLAGGGERAIAVEPREGVDRAVDERDVRDVRLHDLDRRRLARAYEACEGRRTFRREVGAGHHSRSCPRRLPRQSGRP